VFDGFCRERIETAEELPDETAAELEASLAA
jgi:hypothetical protein